MCVLAAGDREKKPRSGRWDHFFLFSTCYAPGMGGETLPSEIVFLLLKKQDILNLGKKERLSKT
jgi:hypothetical protein